MSFDINYYICTMNDLKHFKEEAVRRNLCVDYALMWAKCGNNKEKLFDLSLEPQAIPYIATSIYEGWGLSSDYIFNEFYDYINGRRIAENISDVEAATASLYVRYNLERMADLNESVIHICDCAYILAQVKKFGVSQIHISNNSHVRLYTGGNNILSIYLYDTSIIDLGVLSKGDNITIYKYSDNAFVKFKKGEGKIKFKKKELKIQE